MRELIKWLLLIVGVIVVIGIVLDSGDRPGQKPASTDLKPIAATPVTTSMAKELLSHVKPPVDNTPKASDAPSAAAAPAPDTVAAISPAAVPEVGPPARSVPPDHLPPSTISEAETIDPPVEVSLLHHYVTGGDARGMFTASRGSISWSQSERRDKSDDFVAPCRLITKSEAKSDKLSLELKVEGKKNFTFIAGSYEAFKRAANAYYAVCVPAAPPPFP